MTESLEDILSGEEKESTETAAAETAETEESTGTEKPEEKEAETPPETGEATEKEDSTPESESWTKAAVMDERRKRQAAERELEELRRQQQPKEEPKRPDVFEDPDGAFNHVQTQLQQDLLNERIKMSRDFMQMLKPDYDDMEQVFIQMAEDNPALVQQLHAHPNPARFAYEQATKHREYQQMQDVDSYKAKLREEVKAELLKEMQAEQAKEAQKGEAVTPSLAKTRSSGGQTEPTGDESLEDILGR